MIYVYPNFSGRFLWHLLIRAHVLAAKERQISHDLQLNNIIILYICTVLQRTNCISLLYIYCRIKLDLPIVFNGGDMNTGK